MPPFEEVDDTDTGHEAVEAEARKLGWAPQEEFKGNKDNWIDAAEFVARGEQILPIVKENNKRLKKELDRRDATVTSLQEQLNNTNAILEKFEKKFAADARKQLDSAEAGLKAELRKAVEDRDVDAELELREKLDEVKEKKTELKAEEDAAEANKKKVTPKVPQVETEINTWMDENPWFTSEKAADKKQTKLFNRIAEDLRDEGSELVGKEFLDEALRLYNEQYGEEEEESAPRKASKVATASNSRTPANKDAGGKAFTSLPKEAQNACMEFADTLVGLGKRYATLAEWQKKYTADYHSED